MNSPVAIQTLDPTRKLGATTALDRLNLTVEAGKIFGLPGPNGAGKSTTIKILTTLQEPNLVRSHIGYVPQMVSAGGALTGWENLLLSARLYGIPGLSKPDSLSRQSGEHRNWLYRTLGI